MKLLTFYSGDNEIRVHNDNWTGKEKVYYNDEEVSSKFSFFGAWHKFTVIEQGEEVKYVVNIKFGMWGLGFDVLRNDVPLMLAY